MWTAIFWRDAAERAIRTAAQVGLGLLITSDGVGIGLLDIDWPGGLALTGSAVLASVLTSIVGARVGDPATASLLSTGRHAR